MRKQDNMLNVMAALRTFGVEYGSNTIGFYPETDKIPDWVKETIEFKSPEFERVWKDFVELEGYGQVSGSYFIRNETGATIIFDRLYIPTDEDCEAYAAWCGCSSFIEAQYNYGDMPTSRIGLAVEVGKSELDSFVRTVAKYCW